MAVAGQRIDPAAFGNEIRTCLVGVCAHVAVRGTLSARVLEDPFVAVLAIDRGRGRVDDLPVLFKGNRVGRTRSENEFSRAGTLDNMWPVAIAVRAQLAARLLGENDPLVFPCRQVLG